MDYSMLIKEGRGSSSRLITPGVVGVYNKKGSLTATAVFIEDGYILKYTEPTRSVVYKERAALLPALALESRYIMEDELEEELKSIKEAFRELPKWA